MPKTVTCLSLAAALAAFLASAPASRAADAERGKYLVGVASCIDCHTPGYFLGKPDFSRNLSGSEVGFDVPGLGIFYGPNLTPDKATGLGNWTDAQIVTALTKGIRPDGRELAPVMPWRAFANLTADDLASMVMFLRTLPVVANKVPGPFGPNDKPTSFVMKVLPPDVAGPAGPTPK